MTFEPTLERLFLLNGRIASRQLTRNEPIESIADVEYRVFSQWGEDGIIDWLVSHVDLPNHRFVEFGVGSFEESNCRFLLQNQNWQGLVFDSSSQNIERLRGSSLYWMYDVTARQAFITVDNINDLISSAGFEGPIGILSVDIDGNDYWVWDAINCVSPAIVICECNPIFGDQAPLVVPYDAGFERLRRHHSGLYFGASIRALEQLASRKGYVFLGTCSNGINGFFVQEALAERVISLVRQRHAFPAKHRDSRDLAGNLTFTRGLERLALIEGLPVLDLRTGQITGLGPVEALYSDRWLSALDTTE